MDAEQWAALVERIADEIAAETGFDGVYCAKLARLSAAAVEDAGWRAPSAPLTADDRKVLWDRVMERMGDGVPAEAIGSVALEIVSDVLRHPLLAARGVRLEGEPG